MTDQINNPPAPVVPTPMTFEEILSQRQPLYDLLKIK
jgi:hypothetical protein